MKARIFHVVQQLKHPESGKPLLSETTINEALNHKSIDRWAYILHDKDVYIETDEQKNPEHKAGSHKPDHWHIVLQCVHPVELDTIAKWFQIPSNYVEVPSGLGKNKFCYVVEYLTHESEHQLKLGKYRYPDAEIKSNFSWREMLDKWQASKAKYGGRELSGRDRMRYDVLYNGMTLRKCIERDKVQYMSDFEKLKKLRLEYISLQQPPRTRINFYVCGQGGVGKGLLCRALARSLFPDLKDDDDIYFEVGSNGATFEGYDGQPVIIWNDCRASDLLHLLKERGNVFDVFDTHPTRKRQNIKYSSINLCNAVNIVNSVQPYFDFLGGLAGEFTDRTGEKHEAEDKRQSYRRFPFIIPLYEEDFDLMINKGFYENSNNFFEYIEYKHIRCNMQQIVLRCGSNIQLAREIAQQTVQPITKKFHEIIEIQSYDAPDEDLIRSEFRGYGHEITADDVLPELHADEFTPLPPGVESPFSGGDSND